MGAKEAFKFAERASRQMLSPAAFTLRLIMNTLRILALLYSTMVFGGAALFMWFEKLSLWDSLYWSVVTVSTLGYGDISPKTVGGRLVCMTIVQLAIFVVVPAIVVHLLRGVIEDRDAFTHGEQELIKRRLNQIYTEQRRHAALLEAIARKHNLDPAAIYREAGLKPTADG